MKLKDELPYVIAKPNAEGGFTFHFQPSARLRGRGVAAEVLGRGPDRDDPPAEVRSRAGELYAAIKQADPARRKIKLPARRRKTFAELVDDYKARRAWAKLADSTRYTYEFYLAPLLEFCGDIPADVLATEPLIERLQEFLDQVERRTPAMATQMKALGRAVFNLYIKQRPQVPNPFAGVELDELDPRGQVWPDCMVSHFVEAADKMGLPWVGTVVLEENYLGQRPCDILRLTTRTWRPDPQTGRWRFWFQQKKTGAIVAVPAYSELEERLAKFPPVPGSMYLVSKPLPFKNAGKPYSESALRNKVREILAVAAKGSNRFGIRPWADVWAEAVQAKPDLIYDYLPTAALADPSIDPAQAPDMLGYQQRDLRRTAVVRLIRLGANKGMIGSVSGHADTTIDRMMTIYGPRDSSQAAAAIELLEAKRRRERGVGNG